MPIEVINKPEAAPEIICRMRPMVPLRVVRIQSLIAGSDNGARWDAVKEAISISDVCVKFEDAQTHSDRVLHCRSGILLTGWFTDYLLFEYATDIARVVIAKPEN